MMKVLYHTSRAEDGQMELVDNQAFQPQSKWQIPTGHLRLTIVWYKNFIMSILNHTEIVKEYTTLI